MARPKQFDTETALKGALEAFWHRGYEATSLNDLLDAMAIQRGSFYATFKSKHETYLQALEAYIQDRADQFTALADGVRPVHALRSHIDMAFSECISSPNQGCFAVNASGDRSPHDEETRRIVLDALTGHERFLESLIGQAKDQGDLAEATDPQNLARVLLGTIIAMRGMARAGLPRQSFQALRDHAMRLLEH